MNNFEYEAATTIDEAVSLLAASGDRARVLAGGTDLIVQLRERLKDADLIVDVKKIPELTQLTFDEKTGLTLGASTPCYQIYETPEVAQAYPALADAARIIGGWQIQTRASVGGNLCNASPAADSVPPLVAYQATCHIAGPSGTRVLNVAQFCTSPGKNALERGEFLVSLHLPPQPKRSGAHYLRFIPRNEMDIAVVGCAAWVQLEVDADKIAEAHIALAAVAPTVVTADEAATWLAGQSPDEATLEEAGRRVRSVARPISDMRGPAEYREHLVGILAKRALAKAVERARQS